MSRNEVVAFLDGIDDATLNQLRLDTIPRILRERSRPARSEEYDSHQADYAAQADEAAKAAARAAAARAAAARPGKAVSDAG